MAKVLRGNIYTHIFRYLVNNGNLDILNYLLEVIMVLKFKVISERVPDSDDEFLDGLTLMQLDRIHNRVLKRISKLK